MKLLNAFTFFSGFDIVVVIHQKTEAFFSMFHNNMFGGGGGIEESFAALNLCNIIYHVNCTRIAEVGSKNT